MTGSRYLLSLLLLKVSLATAWPARAEIDPEVLTPVPIVQDARLEIRTPQGTGVMPVHLTRDWATPQPSVERAVIVIHGWPRRDLRAGEFAASKAGEAAGHTMIITPQFLIQADIEAHQLPNETLRWGPRDWAIGIDATEPAAISSFDVLDAILNRLIDRRTFPSLRDIVIAGHSAGGRFVQRYAAVGHGPAPAGIHLRYVVANPSDYLYLDDARPLEPQPGCGTVGRWGYGLGDVPRYVHRPVNPATLRAEYIAKDIVYLLGTADDDPHHPQLDQTCGAQAQGATRLQRGLNYVRMLSPGPRQTLLKVPGIGHRSSPMLGSACGVFALFGAGSCEVAH